MRRVIEAGLAFGLFAACGASTTEPSQPPPVTVLPPTTAATAGTGAATPVAPTPMATAGTAAPTPTNPTPTNPTPTNPTPTNPTPTTPGALAMDECNLDTGYPGDEFCINEPPTADGFQMHLGPTNYDNPGNQWLMQPGTEITENVNFTATNTTDVYYYWRQYRMRPGSHHLIITTNGRRLGGSSNAAKDNPEAGVIAPENQGVGMPLAARAPISNSLHYFNFTQDPIIKEVWVNFWYRDAESVTEPTREIFSMLQMGIAPGQHVNKHGACRITSPGRLLTVYGHVHAHNQRFSVWRTRGSDKMLVHEAYDWEHPNISEYSSTVMNPPLNPTAKTDGGYTGIVDLMSGDVVEFECEILNDTNSTFVGLNEAEDDEMCIMIGDTVGTTITPGCTSTTTDAN